MSLEKIIQKIKKDADSEAGAIIREAEQKAGDILAQGQQETQGIIEKMEREHEKNIEGLKKKMLSAARREVRHMTMRAKEEVILDCFAQAEKYLGDLKGQEYAKLVKTLMLKAKPLVKKGVVIPSRDVDKKIARELGFRVESHTVSSLGGVLIQDADGSMEIDNTFEGLLTRKHNEIRIKIAKMLFT
jgi:V/A-type H+-transporting ATPase subunit E